MIRCRRRDDGCPWELSEGDLFCGLCGTANGTCDLEPAEVARGLVFYPRTSYHIATALALYNRGNVPAPVRLSIGASYQLGHAGARARTLELNLLPGDPNRLHVTIEPQGHFPAREESLEITTPVCTPVRVPLIASGLPVWQLFQSRERLDRGPRPIDLYLPADGAQSTWQLAAELVEGAAILEDLVLIHGSELLHLQVGDELPRLLRPSERQPFQIQLVAATIKPCKAVIEIRMEGLPPVQFTLNVYPRQPIVPRLKVLEPARQQRLIVGGARPAHIVLRLENAGAGPAQLRKLRSATEGIQVERVRLSAPGLPEGSAFDYPCDKEILHPEVEKAYLPGPLPEPAPPDLRIIESVRLQVDPGVRPLGETIVGALHIMAVSGDTTYSTYNDRSRPLPIEVPARSVQDLLPKRGHALIDYGTVHTCVRLCVHDGEQGESGPVPLELEQGGGADSPEQLKSVYRVRRWQPTRPPTLEFGHSVWEELANYVEETDYAAKLRLGTQRKRPLRDRDNTGILRMINGKEAASLFLREVLERVAQQRGYRPRLLKLTYPAAFSKEAREDLQKAIADLGDVELKCSEPEAYLVSLASDSELIKRLKKRLADPSRHSRRALVGLVFDFGGGTTDVTLFHFTHSEEDWSFEIVASYGFESLSGEALTTQLAVHLKSTLPVTPVFPFPEIRPGEIFHLDALDDALDERQGCVRHNFSQLRKLAEEVKCTPKRRGPLACTLRDQHGKAHQATVTATEGDDRGGVRKVVSAMIEDAVSDLLQRISMMNSYRLLDQPVPDLVAVAGNSGRLWCLEEIFLRKLRDAGVKDPLYHFNSQIAKTGVLAGLAVWDDQVGVVRRSRDSSWWYVMDGTHYKLVLPPGYPLDEERDPAGLIPLKDPVRRRAFQLYRGPGPEEVLTFDEGGRRGLQLAATIELPPALSGQFVQIAMSFQGGLPGLWVRLARSKDASWTWLAATPRASSKE